MPAGRPSEYRKQYAKQARQLCELGATDFDLARFFDVTTVTIWRWQIEHREFCNALKAGKDACDDRVERSLYHRAVGYSHEAVKIGFHEGCATEHPYIEHAAPDVGAAKLWLSNRRGDRWRDKQEVDHGGKIVIEIVDGVST